MFSSLEGKKERNEVINGVHDSTSGSCKSGKVRLVNLEVRRWRRQGKLCPGVQELLLRH